MSKIERTRYNRARQIAQSVNVPSTSSKCWYVVSHMARPGNKRHSRKYSIPLDGPALHYCMIVSRHA